MTPSYDDLVCPVCGSKSWGDNEMTCMGHGNKVHCNECGWRGVDSQLWPGQETLVTRKEFVRRAAACVRALAGVPQDVLDSPKLNAFLVGMPAMHHRALMEWEPFKEKEAVP